jgi:hypothetical protein
LRESPFSGERGTTSTHDADDASSISCAGSGVPSTAQASREQDSG